MSKSVARLAEPRERVVTAALEGVPHAFLTGIGHEGEPDPALVVQGGKLVLLKQVHSADAVIATSPFDPRPAADALVTATGGLVLGIVTADCAPVLLADKDAGVVGAAHAGWRGAFDGVLENTVAAMEGLGACRDRIAAAIGPTIACASYEVDTAFRDRFLGRDTALGRFFRCGSPGHYQFDLPAFVASRLAASGIDQIDDAALDTYADPARFHSFRRATHRGEPTYGRQFSLIALPD